uniref:Uncharacterized protein n=1 Tax=Opuntia streptacantha TaxID=393608 RepID=A0A7C9FE86_OPUST
MFGGDDTNQLFPVSVDNGRLHDTANSVLPMQLDVLTGCNAGIMNVSGLKNASVVNRPMKSGRGVPIFSQHKLPVTLRDNPYLEEAGRSRSMLQQIPVSTGLRLSYGEEEHNSSLSSAGESKTVNLSSTLAHSDILQTELVRQNDELDQYIRVQEEATRKGITQLKHRHTISILNALEKEVSRKLHEKDIEIENFNRKNKELVEKIRQLEAESLSWHYKAKENESFINLLKSNINQILLRGAAAFLKEGCGESMVDDAVSSCNQSFLGPWANVGQLPSVKESMNCKACKERRESSSIHGVNAKRGVEE